MIKTDLVSKHLTKSQLMLQEILALAGIEINGNKAWDIQVYDERFYDRVLKSPSLGAGESYMDGWWECERLDEFFYRFFKAQIQDKLMDWHFIFRYIKNYLLNLQTIKRSLTVANTHYNLDNQLYEHMLGPSMAYTCGYWQGVSTLDEAQTQKYELVCKKINLTSHDTVLELGCGWGGFARYATQKYGCKMVSVNISEQQIRMARQLCADLPVEIYHTDYRNVSVYNPKNIQFDKVVSIGMCEHVGSKNYPNLMKIIHQQLKNHGLFLLHTIGNNKTFRSLDPWINKYIFPNGEVPSIKQLGQAIEQFFVMEDWHNFGADYDKTLMAWHENFQAYWPELAKRYDLRFYRMWVYYLLACAGVFRARDAQLWQIVLSKGRGQEAYRRPVLK